VLFADDTLIMCDEDFDQILNLDHILLCFEAISGLKVNLQNYELVVVGEVPHIEELASILCCNISSLLLRYLGLPLGAPFKSKAIWDGLVEKMEKMLASWKKIYLSKGRRLTLIKRTLSPIPSYFLSLIFTSWHRQEIGAFSKDLPLGQSKRGSQVAFGELEDSLLPYS